MALGVVEKSALYSLRAGWPIWHDAPATPERRSQEALARLRGGRCYSHVMWACRGVAKRLGTAGRRENCLQELEEEEEEEEIVERGRHISEQTRVREEVAERRGTSENR